MALSDEDTAEFRSSAIELLDVAEKNLLKADQSSDFRQVYEAIFRTFHNLKVLAVMIERPQLIELSHRLEDILVPFAKQKSIPPAYVDLFLRGVDAARSSLDGKDVKFDYSLADGSTAPATEKGSPAISPDAFKEFFVECLEMVDRITLALQSVDPQVDQKETIESVYRDTHSLKGAAYLFGFTSLGSIAHKMESRLDSTRSGSTLPTKELVDEIFTLLKTFEAELDLLAVQIKRNAEKQSGGSAKSLTTPDMSAPLTAEKSKPSADSEAGQSVRVSLELLDNLMTMMGELVLVRNRVLQFTKNVNSREFLALSKKLNLVTTDIQGEMMKTRMQPIGNILSKFNRVVRDLSIDLKKDIQLRQVGAETELDRNLLEAIKDPLTHIVRNSCDHGLESPDERISQGKNRVGTITIKSYHEGGMVIIEVSDDGRGLNPKKLIEKALEKGLLQETQVTTLSEKDTFELIFKPGFSTAASVTSISGRGVGMDVVRTNVEKLGGSVEISSREFQGMVTQLKIPLTLAIVPALIVRGASGTFAIPQVKILELLRADQSHAVNRIEVLQGTPVFRLRGNLLPLVNLNTLLGLTPSGTFEGVTNIVVLNGSNGTFGLVVDSIQEAADIVVKPINELIKSLKAFSGATFMGDGSIALILDVTGLAKLAAVGNEKRYSEEANSLDNAEKRASEIQEYLVVEVAGQPNHALVMSYVHRLEEFPRQNVERAGGQMLIRYGQGIMPLISMSELLNPEEKQAEAKASSTICVVVVKKAGKLYGLIVDDVLDTLSTEARVETRLANDQGIAGHLSTDTKLLVVVDPFVLIDAAHPEKGGVETLVFRGNTKFVPPAPGVSAPLKVLVADDVVFFRRAIAEILEKAGYEVTLAKDGHEALQILEQRPNGFFDVVVSDIEMPKVNGLEFAKAVRAESRYQDLPLLAVSSRSESQMTQEGLRAGFNLYLEKLKPSLLLEAVAQLTRSRRGAA